MNETTIFPREKRADFLFEKILNDPSCGAVFRVKGFLKKEDGQWLELNATRHEISIRPTKLGQEIMIVIGEKLNKEVIDGYWK